MGFWDKLEKSVKGFGGAIQAPLGLVKDLSLAAFDKDDRDKEFNGILETVLGYTTERGGQAISGGAQFVSSGFDALTPDPIEKPIRGGLGALGRGLETVGREAIREPLSATFTAGSLSSGKGLGTFFDTDTWKEAYGIAQKRSLGQSAALGLMNVDIRDQDEVSAAYKESLFTALSGTFDIAGRLFLDPTVIGAKAGGAAYVAGVTKPITGRENLEKVLGSDRLMKVKRAIDGKEADEIKNLLFNKTTNGSALSVALAGADDAAKDRILRLAWGDPSQLAALRAEQVTVSNQIERALGLQDDLVASLRSDNFAKVNGLRDGRAAAGIHDEALARAKRELESLPLNAPQKVRDDLEELVASYERRRSTKLDPEDEDFMVGGMAAMDSEKARAKAEVDELYAKEERLFREQSTWTTLRAQPRVSILDEKRVAKTRTQTYQKSIYTAPLRTVFDMKPQRMIRVEDPEGDINVVRYMRKSGFDQETQSARINAYMAAPDPESKAALLIQMEDEVLTKLATDAGVTKERLDEVMREINAGRDDARTMLGKRRFDGENRSILDYKDDMDGVTYEVPFLVPQTANLVPLGDLDAVRKALRPIADFTRRHPTTRIPDEMLQGFYKYWKPAMLLRVGWTQRSLIDANLRIMAKVGVASQFKYLAPGVANVARNKVERLKYGEGAELRRTGFGPQTVAGERIEGAFGDDVNAPVMEYGLASSGGSFTELAGQAESVLDGQLRKATGDYRSLDPVKDVKDYDQSWLRDVNEQLGRDLVARQFLAGKSIDEVMAWTKTSEGRYHFQRLPRQVRADKLNTLGVIQSQVESYTLGNAAIKAAALNRTATIKMLDDATEGAREARPIIHGELLADDLGSGELGKLVDRLIQKGYTALGTLPEDRLARHPFFNTMYLAESERIIKLMKGKDGDRLSADDLDLVKRQSRAYALNETRRLFYDAAEKSEFAGMLKFISPFYSSWQDSWTTWAGLAVENPAFIARMQLAWNAPERAGLVVDENGNEIGYGQKEGDTVTYEDGTTSKIGKEEFVRFPLPKGVSRILGLKGLESQGEILFSKKSANFMFQISPGFGPVVNIPTAQIVKDSPTLQEATKFILPYGVGEGFVDSLLPSTARRALQNNKGEDDRVFRNMALRIHMDAITKWREQGQPKGEEPKWGDSIEKAKALGSIRMVASYIMPVLPGFKSPYQPMLDKYRRLRAADPATAEARFLDEEGPQFFALTQSFTKSADGVPPTLEAYKARVEFKELIEQNPDLGRLIVGEDSAAGAFASSVYRSQLENRVSGTSGDKQRNALSVDEIEEGPNVRQGWIEYRRAMDGIEAARIERGLPNLRVKEAEDLALLKRAATEVIGEKYPEWAEKFQIIDRGKNAREMKGLRAIASDERLAKRPDIAGLRDYLGIRDEIRSILQSRESADLTAGSNSDIAEAWETIRGVLAEKNPAFATVMYRFLDRDDLEAA